MHLYIDSNQNGKTSLSGNLPGESFVGKVLLANADALCAAVSPLIPDEMDMLICLLLFYLNRMT